MEIHLFGAATTIGLHFDELISLDKADFSLFKYTRFAARFDEGYYFADLDLPDACVLAGNPACSKILVNFAPIWKFAEFLKRLANDSPGKLEGFSGLLACSSSSVITKRFAFNSFDRHLVARLSQAENQLLAVCQRFSVPCYILRPTLIYGQVGSLADRNLSQLLRLMRLFPVLPIPSNTGLRQPIHASQLAAVASRIVRQLTTTKTNPFLTECIALGGDSTLTYTEMVFALQDAQPLDDLARRCRLVPIPNRLFFLLAAPLLLRSPKAFEAVLRMSADLSGFTPCHQLLGSEAQPFPVLPLA